MQASIRPHLFLLAVLSLLSRTGGSQVLAQTQASQVRSSSSDSAVSAAGAARAATNAPANLSTMGANGYSNVLQPFLGNWSLNSVLPSPHATPKTRPPLAPNRHHRHADETEVIAVPVYIPYEIGYGGDEGETAANNGEAGGDSAEEPELSEKEMFGDDEDALNNPAEQIAPEVARDPVVTQAATVLVFRDGHRSDVVNYAIVGDTLFEFEDELTRKIPLKELDLAATQKANDAIGVEFKLPPASAR